MRTSTYVFLGFTSFSMIRILTSIHIVEMIKMYLEEFQDVGAGREITALVQEKIIYKKRRESSHKEELGRKMAEETLRRLEGHGGPLWRAWISTT